MMWKKKLPLRQEQSKLYLRLFCYKKNDEVILFTPAYDCYEPAIEICGGNPIFFQLKAPDFAINWEEVKKLINQKTRMIIINSLTILRVQCLLKKIL